MCVNNLFFMKYTIKWSYSRIQYTNYNPCMWHNAPDIVDLSILVWRSFEANVIIHEALKRALIPWLSEVNGVLSLHKGTTLYIHIVQPMQAMNSMPCNRVVPPYQPTRKQWSIHIWIVHSNLQNRSPQFHTTQLLSHHLHSSLPAVQLKMQMQ